MLVKDATANRDDKTQQDPTQVEEACGDSDSPEGRRMCSDYRCRSDFCRTVRFHVFTLNTLCKHFSDYMTVRIETKSN